MSPALMPCIPSTAVVEVTPCIGGNERGNAGALEMRDASCITLAEAAGEVGIVKC